MERGWRTPGLKFEAGCWKKVDSPDKRHNSNQPVAQATQKEKRSVVKIVHRMIDSFHTVAEAVGVVRDMDSIQEHRSDVHNGDFNAVSQGTTGWLTSPESKERYITSEANLMLVLVRQ